jgi:hypothetical protein
LLVRNTGTRPLAVPLCYSMTHSRSAATHRAVI